MKDYEQIITRVGAKDFSSEAVNNTGIRFMTLEEARMAGFGDLFEAGDIEKKYVIGVAFSFQGKYIRAALFDVDIERFDKDSEQAYRDQIMRNIWNKLSSS